MSPDWGTPAADPAVDPRRISEMWSDHGVRRKLSDYALRESAIRDNPLFAQPSAEQGTQTADGVAAPEDQEEDLSDLGLLYDDSGRRRRLVQGY